MLLRRVIPFLLLAFLANVQVGCDSKSKAKSEKDDDDDDDKSPKKKKTKKGDDDKADDDKEAKKEAPGVEVPGTKGFLVPPGGTYKHNVLELGERSLILETYDYPLKEFPRAQLRKSLEAYAKKAGWKLEGDIAKASSIDAKKDGYLVAVLIGEAGDDITKLNVTPARPDVSAGAAATTEPAPGDVEDFTGDYNSTDGWATITQAGSKVTIKYAIGNATCTAVGKTLTCAWTERSGSGHAVISKRSDGSILGTWGSGVSTTNGGEWRFTPKKKK